MIQYQTESVNVNSFNQTAKEKVEKIISESSDMITALECVGAMYGIPPTHFTVEPNIKVLKVSTDHVLTPPDVRPNTKAIVCSIGGVLDHISQRINDKLDNRHDTETEEGREHPHVSTTANPNKGEVVSRHIDANGDEIIVYNSGLMDMANTKEAHMKADELRKDHKVPEYIEDKFKQEKQSYFTKEDAIELSTEANIDEDTMNDNAPKPTDISKEIQESAFHLELLSHYRDTDYLGYQLLQEQGFDFVKPTEAFTLEAHELEKKPKINPEDIKHMKFDNTHITKAIQCFNKARDEQRDANKGQFDLTKFVSSSYYKQGIDELSKQFDCKLNVHFKDNIKETDKNNLFTLVFDHQHADKIYVSKSKGFQLNGLPITIVCVNNAIDEEMTKNADKDLFGQFMVASLCHEIFHNIVNAIRCTTNTFIYTSASAMSLALTTQDASTRREIFSRFADTVIVNGDNLNRMEKKRLVKTLCYISALADDTQEMSELEKKMENSKSMADVNQQIDALIAQYEKTVKDAKHNVSGAQKRGAKYLKNPKGYKLLNHIATGLSSTVVGAVIGLPMLKLLPNRSDAALSQAYTDYLNRANKEEYYCDLFAGIYNLPLSFTYGYKHRDFAANEIPQEKLQYLTDLEKNLRQFILSPYPTNNERNYAAYQIAKTILDGEEKISKETRAYCEWIVKNYSSIDKAGVAKNYNHSTFDPDEAKDLDEHIQNLILNNRITVTESYHINRR